MEFSVIGGDLRQAMLCGLLSSDGHEVAAYAIEKAPYDLKGVYMAEDLKQAADRSCIILPLPCCTAPGIINSPLSDREVSLKDILKLVKKDTVILGGRLSGSDIEELGNAGVVYEDYFEREELAVENAIATAEGAIQLAMEETPFTLHGSKCLVIGFGRIGKTLSHYLRSFGAVVTAASRKYSDKAWSKVYGCLIEDTEKMGDNLYDYDIVFNTVPFKVMDGTRLSKLKSSCLCIDLASKPGGVDLEAAKRLKVRCIWALSIPGKVAPLSSGRIIRDTIYNILEEKAAFNYT